MTENFYLDIHEISYQQLLDRNIEIKIFGTQDGLPPEEDGVDILSIKSGKSYDMGILHEDWCTHSC